MLRLGEKPSVVRHDLTLITAAADFPCGYRVDPPGNRAAPTIPPSGDSITTAT
jgi:hypothetical protein